MSKIKSILSYNAINYISKFSTSIQQVKAINSIVSCRTPNMGSHKLSCDCGHSKVVSNSCSNRHCPTCGSFKKELWVNKQQESLLPSHYFHLVFTVPDTLRSFIYFNQKILYDLLYDSVSKTILDLSKNELGVIPGFSLILHTWSQTLMFHPHLHCVLAGGGLSKDESFFKSFRKKFFLHVKVLSPVFKGKFLEGFKTLYNNGDLKFPYDLEYLKSLDDFASFVDNLYLKDWVVFSKPVFKCSNHVIKYLGRYTHRVAISDYRIVSTDDSIVTFSYLDNKDGGKKKFMSLTYDEFMRRFLMHVLPHRFVKIRHYGFLTNRFRAQKVALCRKFIAKQSGVVLKITPSVDKFELLIKLIGKEKLCCPNCGNFYTYTHEVNLN
ncbi:transposase-like zinc-binding protein [Natranaerovirga hydrolytica]|uniref:Transposase-like zinc-binding protein n=1 Tax=Natranaerovirga hydrolytica TaxID=680378 RepID=A0A4R1MXN3_9FIRM|nr:IS91 family transposase [Natranaerovirga hydrolytica]TCK98027.1 transposase-like zinc-binding protein [Natranaerovirga hydrolytica]